MVGVWYNARIMKSAMKSWWGHKRPSDEYLNQLVSEADSVRERVSKYSPEEKATLLKRARATIKKRRKKV